MACRLTDAKPLSEPMLDYCQLDPCEHTSMKIYQNTAIFIEENARENVVCEMASILSRPQCVNRHLSQLGGSLESCLWHTDTINGTLSALIFIRKQQGGHKTQLHLGALRCIGGLGQDCGICSTLMMEIPQVCTKSSVYTSVVQNGIHNVSNEIISVWNRQNSSRGTFFVKLSAFTDSFWAIPY